MTYMYVETQSCITCCITCMVGLVPHQSGYIYMVAVTGSMHKSIYRSSGSSWFGLFVSQLDRLQSANVILHSSVILYCVDFVNSHTMIETAVQANQLSR